MLILLIIMFIVAILCCIQYIRFVICSSNRQINITVVSAAWTAVPYTEELAGATVSQLRDNT